MYMQNPLLPYSLVYYSSISVEHLTQDTSVSISYSLYLTKHNLVKITETHFTPQYMTTHQLLVHSQANINHI